MRVISIKEPYASLIKDKKKFIETRSWKTNYRGVPCPGGPPRPARGTVRDWR